MTTGTGQSSDGALDVQLSPPGDEERSASNLLAAMKRFGIDYPVAQDNGYRTWNAYGTRFWPALYLADGDGRNMAPPRRGGTIATDEASGTSPLPGTRWNT